MRGIFAGYRFPSGGVWSGDYPVDDETALRRTTAWHYVHLHRIREIVLPIGKMFTFPAKENNFFKNLEPKEEAEDNAVSSSSSPSTAPEQEAPPAESGIMKD